MTGFMKMSSNWWLIIIPPYGISVLNNTSCDMSVSFVYILKAICAEKKINDSSWCTWEALYDAVFSRGYVAGKNARLTNSENGWPFFKSGWMGTCGMKNAVFVCGFIVKSRRNRMILNVYLVSCSIQEGHFLATMFSIVELEQNHTFNWNCPVMVQISVKRVIWSTNTSLCFDSRTRGSWIWSFLTEAVE